MKFICYLVLLGYAATAAMGFSNGAPPNICKMPGSTARRPVHDDFMPQFTCPPYKLTHNITGNPPLYRPGEGVNFTLEATEKGVTFKGFLLTSDSSTSYFFGSVKNLTVGVRGTGNCGMTHTDNSTKTSVSIVWVPAQFPVGTVQFKAVVVKDKATFWEGVRSNFIYPDKSAFPSDAELTELVNKQKAAFAASRQRQNGSHNRTGTTLSISSDLNVTSTQTLTDAATSTPPVTTTKPARGGKRG